MPNHCESDLKVNGSKKDIEAFFAAVKSDDKLIDANKILPYPKVYADADENAAVWRKSNPDKSFADAPKDGYNSGGYEWCVSNWGTKWGMYDFSEIETGKTFANVSFQSAWAPPLPLILKASEMFPEIVLTLRYFERGAGYKGVLKVQAGNVLLQSDTTYSGQRGG